VEAVSSDHEVEAVGLGVLVHRHRPLPVSQYAAVGPRRSRPRSGPAKAAWATRPPTLAGRGAVCAGVSQPMEDATGFDDVAGEANRSTMAAERRGR
jgi:hypothetical protein